MRKLPAIGVIMITTTASAGTISLEDALRMNTQAQTSAVPDIKDPYSTDPIMKAIQDNLQKEIKNAKIPGTPKRLPVVDEKGNQRGWATFTNGAHDRVPGPPLAIDFTGPAADQDTIGKIYVRDNKGEPVATITIGRDGKRTTYDPSGSIIPGVAWPPL